MKKFHWMSNVGKAKYIVSFHDGIQKHKDGSEFFDCRIFKNKPSLNAFLQKLILDGYKETNW